jgi:hypothetical protein
MRWFNFLVFGSAALAIACGDNSDIDGPIPDPGSVEYCAVQHVEGNVVVCDELFAEAPFVHVPQATSTSVTAGLQNDSFVTAAGKTYLYQGNTLGSDPEGERHSVALYALELHDGGVKSFRPVVVFDEALFIAPFLGRALEGAISRHVGEQFAEEATLPVRLEVLDQPGELSDRGYTAVRARITNRGAGVTAADGSCMPALSSYGEEAPFADGASVEVHASRSPWMHGFGDDQFVFDVIVDGRSIGTMMAPQWYLGPIDLVRGALEPSGTYSGFGHGSPGSIPSFEIEAVDAGGKPCTP